MGLFGTSKSKYLLWGGLLLIILITQGIFLYPIMMKGNYQEMTGDHVMDTSSEISLSSSKTAQEYYDMFQCPCCGKPIDSNCCGMATQRKEYLDKLLLEGPDENEVVYQMLKKFGSGTLMDPSVELQVKDYLKSKAPDNPPNIDIDDPKYNFGTVSQAQGIVSTIFNVKNTGKSNLIIDGMDTSCMCTSASLIYDGKEGPIFGMSMHGENPEDYELIIPPGKSAQLKVYYDPNVHGKQDKPELKITRTVTITSNDPVDFQKSIRIDLRQVP